MLRKNIKSIQWHKENIFNFKKADGVAYLIFYIIIPCLVTVFSLLDYPSDSNARIYCYVSILISALNCIYDAFNRWVNNQKTLKNGKLFFMMIGASIIVIYCFFIIFSMLLIDNADYRQDSFLLAYFLVIVIAISDIVCCFTKEIVWMGCIDYIGKEV